MRLRILKVGNQYYPEYYAPNTKYRWRKLVTTFGCDLVRFNTKSEAISFCKRQLGGLKGIESDLTIKESVIVWDSRESLK